MRNLKRALSLVMAMALIVGMMVVSASAASKDFTDSSEIQHKEAVNTMVALNVISGKEDGSYFDPNGTLTRAEMAKIVAYVMNGGVEPNIGTKLVPTYSDIDNHWAEAYIEYCTSMGIINGDGAGKFNPEGTLTAEQCAKMFLTAMGYNANVFGFTGNDWAINVGRYANEAGLYEELGDVTPSNVITRDDAAQMAYNAIQATMMERTWSQDLATGQVGETYAPWIEGGVPVTLLDQKFNGTIKVGYLTGFTYDSNKETWTYTFDSDGNFSSSKLTADNAIGNENLTTDADYTSLFGQQVKVIYDKNKSDKVYGVYANESSVLYSGYAGDVETPATTTADEIKVNGTTYRLDDGANATGVYTFNKNTTTTYLNSLAATDKGYILLKEAVKIVIITKENGACEQCGAKLLTAAGTVNGKAGSMTDGNAIVPLTVVNNPGFDLPKTGGYGTWMFTIGGVALLGAAAFIVVKSRKHKSEQ